ncbi:cupin domain-containing protein [Haliea sp. E1-2-M8]|uniref:cupin domain-containing protein n=1 Tax=Haliea sp. E1-2-M8 TaxID=3064706 RepID=UPI00272629CE|nr:cupin domain-containing protein [Haliea sp. E1-2-M8]MDO8863080.1 cupin domain-containing protein [Haliea sp. E1-2-M8]
MSFFVQAETPEPLHPEQAGWSAPLGLAGVAGAWLLGNQADEGIYQYRVRLEPGARIPPHTHPDTRNSTVLKGTLWVGFGESFDEGALVAVPEGSLYLAPAGTPHFLWARDGAVEYQESGVGPSGTRVLQ